MVEKEIETVMECYKNAPDELLDVLLNFRKDHKINSFEFNGKTVNYISTGSGENTVLMFHGALGSADTPYTEILRLKNRFRIITPTIRDFENLEEASNAINEILLREQVKKVFVRGGSFGAFIAQAYFKRNYGKIDRIVLINGIPPKGEYTKKDWRYIKLFKGLISILPERLAKKMMLKELSKLGKQEHELTPQQQDEVNFLMMQVHERLAKVKKKHILESMMLVVDFDLNYSIDCNDCSDWNGKVLLITDTEDNSFKYIEKLKAQFPHPQTKIFEKAGHLLQIVYKSEFEKVIDDFFDF